MPFIAYDMARQGEKEQNLGYIKNIVSYSTNTPNPKIAPISANFGKHMGQAATATVAPNDPVFPNLLCVKR
jgi:hypothetical protein